jgi:ASC-1-like (ASCH) protein
MVSIVIPTQSYLKKYLLRESKTTDGVLRVTTNEFWGIVILKILQKRASYESKPKEKYNDILSMDISEFFYDREGLFLSRQNISFYNNFLQDTFQNAMFNHITINMIGPNKTTIEKEIKAYLSFYNITEHERSLETVLRAYGRWREDRNILITRC